MSQPAKGTPRDLLLLAIGGLCISLSPIIVKSVGGASMGPTAIGFWRTAIGTAGFLVIALILRRSVRLSGHALVWGIGAGVAFAVDIFFWHRSIIYVGAGMATILGNTQVFGSAILSYFLFKEKLTPRLFVAAAVALISVAMLVGVFSSDVAFDERYSRGILFGLITGVAYAGFIVGLKKSSQLMQDPDALVVMAVSSAATAIVLGVVSYIEGHSIMPPDFKSWQLLLALGLIVHVFGWWLITSRLRRVETHRASLLLLLQPTMATILGAILFQEHLDGIQIVGAVMTLGAIYFGSIRQ